MRCTGSERSSPRDMSRPVESSEPASSICDPSKLPTQSRLIFSQGSGSGRTRSGSQDGPTIGPYGPGRARVNLSVTPEAHEVQAMRATSGPPGSPSFASADLQSSLENKLRANLAGTGSTLYRLTWKHWDMPSGRRICALRASVRRTFGSGCFGWLSPTATDAKSSARHGYMLTGNAGTTFLDAARLSGWATPTARDHKSGSVSDATMRRNSRPLSEQARRLADSGPTPSGSAVQTESRGQLNPDLPRWLMGLPVEWANCADMATPSSHRSQLNLFGQSWT